MTINNKLKKLIIALIVLMSIVISSGLATVMAFYSPNLYDKKVSMPQKVKNNFTKTLINAPVYNNDSDKIGDIYVSDYNGKDENDGSEIKPYKTIEKARDRAREIKHSLNKDVNILIMDGTYRTTGINLKEEDSGVNGNKIIYRNYPNHYPIIDGTKIATNWTLYKDDIYVADIEKGSKSRVVVENGNLATMARYPNEGYLQINNQSSSDSRVESFGYKKDKIINSISNDKDLEVCIFPGGIDGYWNWFSHIYPVKSIDKVSKTINVDRSSYTRNVYNLGKGSRYFLQNSMEFLDQKGEYYINSEEGKLYYIPFNSNDIEKSIISYAITDTLINIDGGEGTVSDIEFKGLTFLGTDLVNCSEFEQGAMIYLRNAKNITIVNSKFCSGGKYGILSNGDGENFLIDSNEFYDLGHSGIELYGSNTYKSSKNHIVSNNYIHDMGLFIRNGSGIQFCSISDSVIKNNKITRTPRYSISLKGDPIDKKFTEVYSGGNVIEYNDCSAANEDTQDTGVIELWCSGKDNVIRGNYIHDSNIYFSFGFGIYVDDYNENTLVEDNILHNLGAMTSRKQKWGKMSSGELLGAIFTKYNGTVIRNNIIVECKATNAILINDYLQDTGTYEEAENIRVEKNVVLDTFNEQSFVSNNGLFRKYNNTLYKFYKIAIPNEEFKNNINKYLVQADNNVIFNTVRKKGIFGKEYTVNVSGFGQIGLEKWKKESGYDQNTKIIDPKLDKLKFVITNQEVLEMGIKNINFESIGIQHQWGKELPKLPY